MPTDAQTRLLRVLQQGEYTTVGGRSPQKTDVRIIAASNKDLKQLIDLGTFREDLYYRLNVVPIRLPALRERAEDIPDLVRHFFKQAEKEGLSAKRIDAAGLDRMKAYSWPGNVRELENLVRRLGALYPEDEISAATISEELKSADSSSPRNVPVESGTGDLESEVERHLQQYFSEFADALPPPGLYQRILRKVEVPLLVAALTATRGNQIRAADLLGLNRNTVRKKIREYGINIFGKPSSSR
jgi:two-component system, NtrC family, nitrogen regulation response regulator GlnG